MIPAKYDFPSLYAGDTHDGLSITVSSVAGGVTSAVDLTSVAIAMQVRDRDDPTILILDLAVGTGITKTNSPAGVFSIDPFTVPVAGSYVYDIEFTYAGGAVKTYMGGRLHSVSDVTS